MLSIIKMSALAFAKSGRENPASRVQAFVGRLPGVYEFIERKIRYSQVVGNTRSTEYPLGRRLARLAVSHLRRSRL